MLKIVFASHNKHKKQEVADILGNSVELIDLGDLNCSEDIPETQDSLQGNALQKARFVYEKYGLNCFADDTGLEVEALNGAPGVHSARYGGPPAILKIIWISCSGIAGQRKPQSTFQNCGGLVARRPGIFFRRAGRRRNFEAKGG